MSVHCKHHFAICLVSIALLQIEAGSSGEEDAQDIELGGRLGLRFAATGVYEVQDGNLSRPCSGAAERHLVP